VVAEHDGTGVFRPES